MSLSDNSSGSRERPSRVVNRMLLMDTLHMSSKDSGTFSTMRGDDGIKNRPLHELLNYNDDDRILRRTQFEMDTNLDMRQQSSMMGMSMSTLGLGDDAVSTNNRLANRRMLFALSSCFMIVLIGIVTVALIIMGPHLDGFHSQHKRNNEQVPAMFDPEALLMKLKATSTGMHTAYDTTLPLCSFFNRDSHKSGSR
jgi:hypothetical protein